LKLLPGSRLWLVLFPKNPKTLNLRWDNS
jgi:hypothetical protein